MISHKLRTPLVAIIGYMPFLREGKDSMPEAHKKALDVIDQESRHLAYLVEDLLRFTMLSGHIPEEKPRENRIFAARLVEDALAKIIFLLEAEKVIIVKKLDPALEIVGDTALLMDMLKSLMDNAVRFNGKPDKILRLGVAARGDGVEFRVEDNGPGIPPEERGRIFQWFHQVEEDFTGQVRGMGLGLAFVKKVVKMHQGTIDVISKVGEGSAFVITLPGAREEKVE